MNSIANIDGNTIISEISSGGHAIVYKAWDPVLETFYAIKVMRKEASENADRFLTEAKVLAQIKHPNVPTVLNFGRIDDCPFIRMEYIDGKDLGELLEGEEKLPLVVAVSIIIQVARALQFAHNTEYEIYGEKRKGIIHRDVKPGNILIGKNGIVKLTDFGIVKVEKLSIHTSATSILGTPYYMSPEQLDPPDDGEQLDQRSDIYSLGCVLYECLTGKCQYDADTIMIILNKKKTEKYDLSVLKEYPSSIRKIITAATAAEKESRYSEIGQLISDLEKVLTAAGVIKAEEEVQNFIESGAYRKFSKSASVSKIWSIIIVCVFTAIGAVLIYSLLSKSKLKDDAVTYLNTSKDSSINALKAIEATDTSKTIEKDKRIEPGIIQKEPVELPEQSRRPLKKPAIHDENIAAEHLHNTPSAFELFQKGQYKEVIRILSLQNPEKLNDSLFLALCGSLLVQNPDRLKEVVFSRSIQDAYLYYLRGRYLYNKGKWDLARNWFLKALTLPSMIPCEESTLYFLVHSAYFLYKNKPNIQNRAIFLNQKEDYLKKYCKKSDLRENCQKIRNLE